MRIDTVQDTANWVRDRRADLGWSQSELGRRIGSTRFWVADLEAGKPTLEVGLVLKALRALGAMVEVRVPEVAPAANRVGAPPGTTAPRIDLDAIVSSEERRG